MPSSITHELIAMETLELLPKGAQTAVSRALDYYTLGAQGPDLFFFYRPLSGFNLGKFLHRNRVAEWFGAMLLSLCDRTGEEFEKCLAYALGFCTHLSADAVFHPFVYRYLEATNSPKGVHQEMENDWDVYFLKSIRGRSPEQYEYPFRLKEMAADGILYRFISDCTQKLGISLSAAPFRTMMRTFSLYLAHFHGRVHLLSPFGLSHLYPNEVPDEAYLRGKQFEALAGAKSADELFLRAANDGAVAVTAFLDAFNADMVLPKDIFSRHMLTGEQI